MVDDVQQLLIDETDFIEPDDIDKIEVVVSIDEIDEDEEYEVTVEYEKDDDEVDDVQ